MLKHTGDEETDLCAMLNKISTVRYKYIGSGDHVQKRLMPIGNI